MSKWLYIGLGLGTATVVGGGLVALRLHTLAQAKTLPATATAGGTPVSTPAVVSLPSGQSVTSDPAVAAADPSIALVDPTQFVAAVTATNPSSLVQAKVTTNDPAPDGDLIIRDGPSATANQIGGAEKDGTVTVLDGASNADFAKITWDGGARWPAATGWAHKSALALV